MPSSQPLHQFAGARNYNNRLQRHEVSHDTLLKYLRGTSIAASLINSNRKPKQKTIHDRRHASSEDERPYIKVCKAIRSADGECLNQLVQELKVYKLGAIITEQDRVDGHNPIHLACLANNHKMLTLLITSAPTINVYYALRQRTFSCQCTPLGISIATMNVENVVFIVQQLSAGEALGYNLEGVSPTKISDIILKLLAEEKTSLLRAIVEQGTLTEHIKEAMQRLPNTYEFTASQIQILEPFGTRYLIPVGGPTKAHALVCYNPIDREGALAEATQLTEALNALGFVTEMIEWTLFGDLRSDVEGRVDNTAEHCSMLFVAVMSHGIQGQLVSQNGSHGEINEILNQVTNGLRLKNREHIPLVMMIQACQTQPSARTDRSGDALVVDKADSRHIVIQRPHTLLLMATIADRVAYRGAYITALVKQLRQADGNIDMQTMHTEAAQCLGRIQTPEMRSTLKHPLILPASQHQP